MGADLMRRFAAAALSAFLALAAPALAQDITQFSPTLFDGSYFAKSAGKIGLSMSSAGLRGALTDESGTGLAYFQGGDLGTPSAGVLANATGLPISTGVSGLGAGVATFLGTPSSANFAAALTDETGTAGGFVRATGATVSGLTLTGTTTLPGAASINSAGNATVDTIAVIKRYIASGSAPVLEMFHSRGTFGGARGAVVSGDGVSQFNFTGDDGTSDVVSAHLFVQVDGAVSTGIVPGRFAFWTRNTAGALGERMRLHSSGGLSLGSATDPGAGLFSATGSITAHSGTAIPAGGTAGSGFRFSSTSNFGVFFGSGAPTLAAAKGSLYLRSDGSGTTNRAYINTDGSTTWTAITTGS